MNSAVSYGQIVLAYPDAYLSASNRTMSIGIPAMTAHSPRSTEHRIDPDMLARWSPRAFSDEAIPQNDLLTILEAARWAPSAFNGQPWHFVYARRNSEHFKRLLDLLAPFNQGWAQHAAALVFIASRTVGTAPGATEATPNRWHAFDAGAAWSLLALQATKLGWYAHGMGGVDFERASAELDLPQDWRIEIGVALGRQGDVASLPEALQAREAPSPRKPLASVISEGRFSA
ncbi:MAG: nitroreductase [Devosia sp.]|jgi:nitroreductase|tara:strand:+ start:12536 stop:13228 length:693 start_codon:yes stop_codon:yes gene_type:complete